MASGSIYLEAWSLVINKTLGRFSGGEQWYFGGYFDGRTTCDPGGCVVCPKDPTGQNCVAYIRALQNALNGWLTYMWPDPHYPMPNFVIGGRIPSKLTVDGIYGPATGKAVTWFQQRQNLAADGVAGTATWTALRAAPIR